MGCVLFLWESIRCNFVTWHEVFIINPPFLYINLMPSFRLHLGDCMAKEFSKTFYKSKTWQRVRKYVWQRDNGLCQDCLKKGLITPGKEVHHIVELTEDNISDASIALDANNLITLCKSCHEARHNASNKNKRYSVNADGSVQAIPPMPLKNRGI